MFRGSRCTGRNRQDISSAVDKGRQKLTRERAQAKSIPLFSRLEAIRGSVPTPTRASRRPRERRVRLQQCPMSFTQSYLGPASLRS